MKIIIGGDIVPTKTNETLFIKEKIKELLGEELEKFLNNSDYKIFNLEVPLTNKKAPIDKCGPNLIAPVETIKGLSKINSDFYTLANNHIMDQGKNGLMSTIKVLEKNNISYAGVGDNINKLKKFHIVEKENFKIGIYCCAEHEFSIANIEKCGVNPFDPFITLDEINELKNRCDYVIVLYHGGKEHYRYPSPYLQKVCRKIVDKGADLVVCQHSHCIGCEENWNNGKIIYGQGNFLFDDDDNEFWNNGLLIDLKLEKNKDNKLMTDINYIPILKNNNSVRISTLEEKEQILQDFYKRSKQIKKENFIKNQYNNFSIENLEIYFSRISNGIEKTFLFRGLNKVFKNKLRKKYYKIKYNKVMRLALINTLECESHNELFINGLKESTKYF